MTTPIIILCLLLAPLFVARAIGGTEKTRAGGTIGTALAFAFFGAGHFVETEAMTRMLPPFVPFATPLVLTTGLVELAIASGLVHPISRRMAGLFAIVALIAFFPVNVYSAFNYTGMGGHVLGPVYLLIRAPLQALLIWWTWFFIVRHDGTKQQISLIPAAQLERGTPNA